MGLMHKLFEGYCINAENPEHLFDITESSWITYKNCDFHSCTFTQDMTFITFINCQFHECYFADGNCMLKFFEFDRCLFWSCAFSREGFTGVIIRECAFYDCQITNADDELDICNLKFLYQFSLYVKYEFIEDITKIDSIKNALELIKQDNK